MNLQFGVCPQCKMEISEERLRDNPVICQHCGFSDQKAMKNVEKRVYKTFLKTSIVLTGFLVASFIQAVNWDKHSLTIIPLKVKEITGMASLQDLKTISEICTERKKWDCVEAALAQTYQMSPQSELEVLAELGKLQFKRGDYVGAFKSLSTYFNQGGVSLDASYDYARVLAQQGQVDQASQVYDEILKAKPDTLQVTVAQNYVRLLMDNSRYKKAKDLLEEIRKSGSNASLFMDKEFQELATYVK